MTKTNISVTISPVARAQAAALAERMAASMTPADLLAAGEHDPYLAPHVRGLRFDRRVWAVDHPQVDACRELARELCAGFKGGAEHGRARRAAMREAVETVLGCKLTAIANTSHPGGLPGVSTSYTLANPHPAIKAVRIGWTVVDGVHADALTFDVALPDKLGGGLEDITMTRPDNHQITL